MLFSACFLYRIKAQSTIISVHFSVTENNNINNKYLNKLQNNNSNECIGNRLCLSIHSFQLCQ